MGWGQAGTCESITLNADKKGAFENNGELVKNLQVGCREKFKKSSNFDTL